MPPPAGSGLRGAVLLAAVLFASAPTGCGISSGPGAEDEGCGPRGPAEGSDLPGGEEASSLFAAAPADPAQVDFVTDDDAFVTDRGYTLWALRAGELSPFSSRLVVANKASGSAEAGYGLVFCHRGAEERMLVAMIDAQGEYIVGEASGSTFTAIVPWTSSAYLKRGFNQDNLIGLRLDPASRTFTLSLNGSDVRSFTAVESGYELGGGEGYIVVISPRERFPGTPVRASFREL